MAVPWGNPSSLWIRHDSSRVRRGFQLFQQHIVPNETCPVHVRPSLSHLLQLRSHLGIFSLTLCSTRSFQLLAPFFSRSGLRGSLPLQLLAALLDRPGLFGVLLLNFFTASRRGLGLQSERGHLVVSSKKNFVHPK